MSKKDNLATYVEDKVFAARNVVGELSKRALDPHATFDDRDQLDESIEDLIRYEGYKRDLKVVVKSEPAVYQRGGPNSFVADLIAAGGQIGAMGGVPSHSEPIPGVHPAEARQRLQRHREEMRYLVTAHNQAATTALAKAGITTTRGAVAGADGQIRTGDLNALTANQGAEFVPPAWFNEYAAGVAYSASTLRSLIGPKPLPGGTMLLNIPRFDTSVDPVVPQNPENSQVSSSMGTTTDSVQAKVIELSGAAKVSLQLLERGGSSVDEAFLDQFAQAWASGIENQLVNGGGGLYAFNGLTNLENLLTVTITGATGPDVVSGTAAAVAAVGNARKRPADAVLYRPGRWAWLNQAVDSNGEAVIRPGTGYVPLDKDSGAYGPVGGSLVYQVGSIPSNLGGGTNQDVIYAVRSADFLLFESVPTFDVLPETYANTLSVQLLYRGYAAAFLDRYESTAQVNGTGLIVPAGF